MSVSVTHREALSRILAAAESYVERHGRWPSQVRVGGAIARGFMGPDTNTAEVRLRPRDPKSTVKVVFDPALPELWLVADL